MTNEPIAIVGSGCRFPGGSNTPSRLWTLLRSPRDCLTSIPKDRFNWEGYHYPGGSHHGSSNTKYTHFLTEDIRKFDPQFFNIQPGEADAIDPQQRLLLETVYEGLESAGLTIEGLQGSQTAVYVGMMGCDYADVVQGDIDCPPTYAGTGIARSIHSNRISYFFDWHGPSMTIDTACSSSMMAIHLAMQALRSGDSRVAVACGASLIITPQNYVILSNLNMIGEDGRAKMWDASANGYARGEGVAAVVLKTLSQAEADGDHIECIIRETSVNQDGRTRGITMPSSTAQADLIRQTYQRAGLDISKRADRPQYFEAHGTGTGVGDPREAEAVNNAFFAGRDNLTAEDTIHIGSIKTVIGHTEGTAGLAGVLKASLALQHGYIPPNMLFKTLNPNVAPFAKHLTLPTTLTPWPEVQDGSPRRASVNSFGFGGSNGHAILESYTPKRRPTSIYGSESTAPTTPFVFSAQSERTLVSILERFAAYIESTPTASLRDIAYTLQYKRSTFSVRTSLSALTHTSLLSKIQTKLSNAATTAIGIKPNPKHNSRILGVFTGQGAQWAGMGRSLLVSSSTAREMARQLDESLSTLPRVQDRPSWTIADELSKDASTSRLGEAALSQPLCTAIQIMLVDMLHSAGIRFHAVVGHSSGEIAAAYAAGFLSATDAIRIAYYRGLYANLASGRNREKGAMMAVGMSPDEARALCEEEGFKGRIAVAACNSSASVTLSGDVEAIEQAKGMLDGKKVFARVLKVDTAYHSHHMRPCAERYLDALRSCGIRSGAVHPDDDGASWMSSTVYPAWWSSVHGGKRMSSSSDDLAGGYWVANMTQAVLFADAVEAAVLNEGPFDMGVEVGPHPALQAPAMQTIQDAGDGNKIPYTGVLSRGKDDVEVFSEALGTLWTYAERGTVDFTGYETCLFPSASKVSFVPDLPGYPWDHERSYWFESRSNRAQRNRAGPVHSLIGVAYGDATDTERKWRNFLIPKEVPWLTDHRLQGHMVLPGAAYAVMAIEAALIAVGQGQSIRLIEIEDLFIHRAISFESETSSVEVVTTLSSIHGTEKDFRAQWTVHSPPNKETDKLSLVGSGSISLSVGEPSTSLLPSRPPSLPNMVDIDADTFYSALGQLGYGYTGAFRSMTTLTRKMDHSAGSFETPSCDLIIHPALLDMAFQALFAAVSYPGDGALWSLHVPTSIRHVRMNPLHCPPRNDEFGVEMSFDARLTRSSLVEGATGDVTIYADGGEHGFLQVEAVSSVPFTKATAADDRRLFSEEVWGLADPDGPAALLKSQKHRASEQEMERALACERAAHYYFKRLREEISPREERGAAPHHQRLLAWAGRYVAEVASGTRPHSQPEWGKDTLDDILGLFERYPDDIDLRLVRSMGEAYPSIVRGMSSPLEHLTKDDMLNELYMDGLGYMVANEWAAGLIKQMTHRHPQLNIVEIGAGTGGATKLILDQIGSTFKSYTYTDISAGFFDKAQAKFSKYAHKMLFKAFDMEKPPTAQGFTEHSFDLVVASNVIHATKHMDIALRNVRSLVKPGGYLVLLELTNQEPCRIGFHMGGLPGWWQGEGNRAWAPTLPPAQWHSLLQKTGWSGIDTIALSPDGLAYPFSVSVTQAMDERIAFLRQPLFSASPIDSELGDLLVVGGTTLDSSKIATGVRTVLGQRFSNISLIETLDELNGLEKEVTVPRTVLVLTELDAAMFTHITDSKLNALKTLFRDGRNVVWVTTGTKSTDPYRTMTIGLGRSIISEQKELRLQFFDSEGVDIHHLCSMLLQLRATDAWEAAGTLDQILWTTEPEYRVENGRQLIPRMYAHREMNERYNSKQRVITHSLSLDPGERRRVGIEYNSALKSYRLVDAGEKGASSSQEMVKVKVVCSLLCAVKVADGQFLFPVLGRVEGSEEMVLGLSASNASIVDVPREQTVSLDVKNGQEKAVLLRAVWEMLAQRAISRVPNNGIILARGLGPVFFETLRVRAAQQGRRAVLVTEDASQKGSSAVVIHPLEFESVLKAQIPAGVAALIDLSADAGQDSLHQRLVACLPPFCEVVTMGTQFALISSHQGSLNSRYQLHDLLVKVSALIDEQVLGYDHLADILTQNLSDVPQMIPGESLRMVDWTADSRVPVQIEPVDAKISFSPDKTYLLIGLTADLGQSLCEWFVAHGAKHIVLTSRNPKIDPKWLASIAAMGANLKVFSMDVTNKASLYSVYNQIKKDLPPIAGVANAAMVLQDIMFSNMTLDDLHTVLRPKVTGSSHLHELFSASHPLDFFILFSSVGLIVGNSGQSNYGAANAFMAALVAQRRSLGLAGSVMHIGAIIGAGYITRAGQIKSGDLDAFGALALSTRDFQQLFGEAVLASPAHSGRNCDIVTGLRSIDPVVDDRVLWRGNPKFGHFFKGEEESKGGEGGGKRAVKGVKVRLEEATTRNQAREIIQECFSARIVVLLQLNPDDMDDNAPLVELGVDSLVAVEARSWFTKQLNVDISVLRLLGGACVVDLVEDTLDRIGADLLPHVNGDGEEPKTVKPSKPVKAITAPEPDAAPVEVKEVNSGVSTPSIEHISEIHSVDSIDSLSTGDRQETPVTISEPESDTQPQFNPVLVKTCPMSYAQSRFWFLRHSLSDPTAFNITFSHSLKGDAHPDELAKAVTAAAALHEGLRTCFFEKGNLPMQGILETSPLSLERRTISSESEVSAEYTRLTKHIYNLETGQCMRILLLELSPRMSYLVIGYHHIAMDGAGFTGFLSELMRIGSGEPIPPPIQYADYSTKMRQSVENGSMTRELSYWRRQFLDVPPVLPLLPMSQTKTRMPLRTYSSVSSSIRIEPVLVARIKRRCRNFQATAFHFYLAVFQTMLSRFLSIEDVCIGIADSNRSDAELQRTMGILVNLLPLRFKPKMSMTFGEAVKEARKTAYSALENSRLPFNVLLENVGVERSSKHFPLFQVFMDYRPGIQERWTLGDVLVQRMEWSYGQNAYDVNLDIMENTSGSAFVTMSGQEYLYGQGEVDMLLKVFVNLLEAFSRNPALRLDEPGLFGEGDINKAVEVGRGPDMPSIWAVTLPQKVDEIARSHGDVVAVRDGDGGQITYRKMMQEVGKIATVLLEAGVTQGDRVALFQHPSTTAISSMLAIMQVGGVYVPLDLRSPVPRLTAIVKDCRPRVILCHAGTEKNSASVANGIKLINVSTVLSPSSQTATLFFNRAQPDAEAVILYTSGSTGTPKGVILPHSAIRNVIEVLTKQFELGPQTVLQQSALTFDLSLNQIFVALANGGTLFIVPQEQRGDAGEITKMIHQQGVSYTLATPSEYSYWLRFGAEHLRNASKWKLAFSLGEELKPRLKEEFRSIRRPDLRLMNTYGPAEITVHSHAMEIPYHGADTEPIPAGLSLPNYSVYILDESLKPVPIGMPGEICVGGAGISHGYLNLPSQTKERFLPNPFAPADWVAKGWNRMYLTGDRGRLRADGALLFEGRMAGSSMIKLRGLRIELGEIEHAILATASPALDEAVVTVRGEDPQFLVAHVVFSRNAAIPNNNHREAYLNQILAKLPLPQYMIPATMILISGMPLTSHNKTDRKAIAAMPLPTETLAQESAASLTSTETQLVRLWETVLSKDLLTTGIDAHRSFFHVGGNSLLLIPLQSLIKDTFHASLAMIDFAESNTVRRMAARIESTSTPQTIDWALETAIPPSLPLPAISPSRNPRRVGRDLRVLYTGATGHSAQYILQKLVEDPRIAKIYCVAIRTTEKEPTFPRPLSITSEKIIQFPGNLLSDRLGLTSEQFTFLSADIDIILHAAANRSFWDSYQVMREPNVRPALELIRLAAPRKIPIHFMSSAAIHVFSGLETGGNYPETRAAAPPPLDGKEGYLASKWASEKIFENAAAQFGVAVYIHRPAPIGAVQRLSKKTVFGEFLRVAKELKLHIPKDSIKGDIDLIELSDLATVMHELLIKSTEETRGVVRYIHHRADRRVHLDEWEAYAEEHKGELGLSGMEETQNATEWIARAKRIGFPFMLTAQNFDLGGEGELAISQRR